MTVAQTVVIGLGHPYRRDDGVGLIVLELLERRRPAGMTLVISSGEPTELIEAWEGSGITIIVDALRVPDAMPGRVHHLVVDHDGADQDSVRDLDLPASASTHGFGLGQTLALARALGRLPGRLELYGIEVTDVDFGAGLSAPVAAAARSIADQLGSGSITS